MRPIHYSALAAVPLAALAVSFKPPPAHPFRPLIEGGFR